MNNQDKITILISIIIILIFTFLVIFFYYKVEENGKYIYGDINDDKVVDKLDLLAIQRYYYGYISNIDKDKADVNSDGVIDMNDYEILKCYIEN